jgi:MATE family multidrug resistance protein
MSVPTPSLPATFRTLVVLAWPIILSRATQSIIGFSDAWMVAPLGESALAATTTGALDTFTLVIFPMGTVFIVQSFVAQLRGRGELESVRRYAVYGLVIALASGILTLAVIPFVPSGVELLGFEPEVAGLMSEYLSIRLLSVGAVVGMEALGNFYGGLGNTKLQMQASVVVMLANFVALALLVEPHFGLPGYGVAGAAWAARQGRARSIAAPASMPSDGAKARVAALSTRRLARRQIGCHKDETARGRGRGGRACSNSSVAGAILPGQGQEIQEGRRQR